MAGVEAAQAKAKQARERALGGESTASPQLTMGPFSLLVNARHTDEERWKDPLQDRERGYEMSQTALEVGMDYRASDNLVWGGLLSYGTGTMDFMVEEAGVNFTPADQAGKDDRDSFGIALFAAYAFGSGAYVDVAAGYDWDDLELERRSVFQETTRTVSQTDSFTRGSTDGRQWWMAVNGGVDWNAGAFGYGVYGGLTYTDSKVDGFQEEDVSGTGLAMSMGSVERTSVLGRIGVRGQRAISTTQGVLLPYMRVEYEHEFDGEAQHQGVLCPGRERQPARPRRGQRRRRVLQRRSRHGGHHAQRLDAFHRRRCPGRRKQLGPLPRRPGIEEGVLRLRLAFPRMRESTPPEVLDLRLHGP